jgi:hypothetical protein
MPRQNPARADRPGGGGHVDGKVLLDFVDDIERIAAFAVHLVAESQDRQVAHPADLEQLAGLDSTPLAPSMTITAASTAVSVR